jgi:hypothetical protein
MIETLMPSMAVQQCIQTGNQYVDTTIKVLKNIYFESLLNYTIR